MKSKTKMRIVAVIICVIVYAIYIAIATAAGWSQGGGILVIAILVGIMRAIWKAASEMGEEEDNKQLDAETPIPTEDQVDEQVETPQIETDQIDETSTEELPPIPVEEDTILPELPPIPQEEEKEIVENIEEKLPEVAQDKTSTTHWQKYKLYYIIGVCLSIVLAVTALLSITHHLKQKQIEELVTNANDAYKQSFYDLALDYLDKAYLLDSNNLVVNYCLGQVHCQKENYSTSIEYFEKVYNSNMLKQELYIKNDTISFDILLYRYSWALIKSSRCDNHKLMLIAQEYMSLYPEDANAYRCMVFTYLKLENKRKAKDWANQMVDKFPENNDSYFCLAYVLSEMGNNREAIKNYKKCIEISPNISTAYNNLGCCYSSIGQYQTAYKYWRKSVEIDGNETAIGNLESHGQNY